MPHDEVIVYSLEWRNPMSDDVMKMMKDNNVKFVDFRFTDTRGKEQHVSMPADIVDAEMFTDGKNV
jgi:glutamine synthetase